MNRIKRALTEIEAARAEIEESTIERLDTNLKKKKKKQNKQTNKPLEHSVEEFDMIK
jgi:copper chaperone CopZ